MTADPGHAAETLVSLCPVVFRSHWAILLADRGRGAPAGLLHDAGPRPRRRRWRRRSSPFESTHRVDLPSGWSPGWGDTTLVVTPLTRDRVIVIGRLGGPAFLESEIARLHHLAALVK